MSLEKEKKSFPAWSNLEDSVVINYAIKSKLNNTPLNNAFSLASKELNRTVNSITFRWYNKLKHINYVSAIFEADNLSSKSEEKISEILNNQSIVTNEEDPTNNVSYTVELLNKKDDVVAKKTEENVLNSDDMSEVFISFMTDLNSLSEKFINQLKKSST